MTSSPHGVTPPDLPPLGVMKVAKRARGQLASALDGRYGAMRPEDVRQAVAWLAAQVDPAQFDYVIGVPEGGFVPAYAFGLATGLRVILASMYEPAAPSVVSFDEEHDVPPAKHKHIYGLASGDRVILVEDEVTSGRTAVNCVRALRGAGVRCDHVATIYAADDPAMRERLRSEHVHLRATAWFSAHLGTQLYR
jgi:orotate phosphoribosyltransferase